LSDDIQFALLADYPNAIPVIASWYFAEWGYLPELANLKDIENKLQASLNRGEIPLVILALIDERVAGVAELKYHETDLYPDKEHWLAGLYVPVQHRGKDVGYRLIRHSIETARTLGIRTLYLQTEQLDGGLYGKMGWNHVEKVSYRDVDVLIMEKHLGN
jgi:GNAT superfamily N-acetyltransferase